ncbi:hypothetical protein ANO11243_013510 [Dothideomycetidae sp. 11243]|nr:hypothetical protein ANO11243_013510 [fungal sp. No.11243]
MEHRAASFRSFVDSAAPVDVTLLSPKPSSSSLNRQPSSSGSDVRSPKIGLHRLARLARPSEPTNLHNQFLAHEQHATSPSHASRKFAPQQLSVSALRWDGVARHTTKWDSLRRDRELFEENGEVAIYLHGRGTSQRGPSFRLPMDDIMRAGCGSLFSVNYDDASYHLATRNLFAWIMEKPLVGPALGQALIDLLERMLLVRPAVEDSLNDCVAYAERMGYLYMANQPDYAVAMLAFAEHAEHEQIRVNAFVHCVGMNHLTLLSPDRPTLSKNTKASITKEAQRMDMKVDRVINALPTFLEEETSSSKLGLTMSQRDHLERFRSFLHSFYVTRYGYWPPPKFTRKLLDDMRFEFECLYELLVLRTRSPEQSTATLGGLCVIQNVGAFNQRHGYTPLDSSLPLLPSCARLDGKSISNKGIKTLLRSKSTRRELLLKSQAELVATVNRSIPKLMDCELVKMYLDFERDSVAQLEPDLVIADARKVRWILIYYTLQMLKSITEAAPEVILSETPTYWTCCNVPPMLRMPDARRSALLVHPVLRSPTASQSSSPVIPEFDETPQTPIHPDCETDDYFASRGQRKRKDSNTCVTPKLTTPVLSRAASFLHARRQPSNRSLRNHSPSSTQRREFPWQTPFERITNNASIRTQPSISTLYGGDHPIPLPPLTTTTATSFGPFELDANDTALPVEAPGDYPVSPISASSVSCGDSISGVDVAFRPRTLRGYSDATNTTTTMSMSEYSVLSTDDSVQTWDSSPSSAVSASDLDHWGVKPLFTDRTWQGRMGYVSTEPRGGGPGRVVDWVDVARG